MKKMTVPSRRSRAVERSSWTNCAALLVMSALRVCGAGRLDNLSFRRRFQTVADAAPDDAAREGGRRRVVEEDGGRHRPQQQVRPDPGAQPTVMLFEDERHGAQPEERLPHAEQEDD